MKFDIPTATKLGLEKYKLWNYIKNNQKVLLAATVDGGQLAWKLTQISAGTKIVYIIKNPKEDIRIIDQKFSL